MNHDLGLARGRGAEAGLCQGGCGRSVGVRGVGGMCISGPWNDLIP